MFRFPKNYKKSLDYLEYAKAKYGLRTSESKHLYVMDLIETGKYKDARDYINDALPKVDNYTYYLIGLSFAKEGKLKKAEEYLAKATQEGDRIDKAYFVLAKVKLTFGEKDKAIELMKKAIEINGNEERYYLVLGLIYEKDGNPDQAITLYEQGCSSIKNKRKTIPLLNNSALLYLKKDDTKKAISYASRALKLSPGDPNVLDTIGWVYFNMKEYDKAAAYLEKATENVDNFALFHYHLGLTYYNIGRLKEAENELEVALSNGKNATWTSKVKEILSSMSH